MHFGPFYLGFKGLQQAYNKLKKKHSGGGSLREAPIRPRVGKRAKSPSLFLKPAKKQRAIKIKHAQKHFKSVLGHHTNYRKETKLKIVKKV